MDIKGKGEHTNTRPRDLTRARRSHVESVVHHGGGYRAPWRKFTIPPGFPICMGGARLTGLNQRVSEASVVTCTNCRKILALIERGEATHD